MTDVHSSITERSAAETVAGFLSAAAIFISLLGVTNASTSIAGVAIDFRPLRLIPASILIALVAVGMEGRNSRLGQLAVVTCAISFFAGFTIAVLTGHPLY